MTNLFYKFEKLIERLKTIFKKIYYRRKNFFKTKKSIIKLFKDHAAGKKILFVSHDATFTGAPILSLNIIRTLSENLGYKVYLFTLKSGELNHEFSKYATVFDLSSLFYFEILFVLDKLRKSGVEIAILNSVLSEKILPVIKKSDMKATLLVHELPMAIKKLKKEKKAQLIVEQADKIIFPSTFVEENFSRITPMDNAKSVILPQGLYKTNKYKYRREEAKKLLRGQFNLPENSRIVLAVGNTNYYKGFDLFIEVSLATISELSQIYFFWVGEIENRIYRENIEKIKNCSKNLILTGVQKDTSILYAASDVYLLTSREDTFPSTVLEAFDAGTPVIGFKNAGGFVDIVNDETGKLVDYEDTFKMRQELLTLINDDSLRNQKGLAAQKLIEKDFNWENYVKALINSNC